MAKVTPKGFFWGFLEFLRLHVKQDFFNMLSWAEGTFKVREVHYFLDYLNPYL